MTLSDQELMYIIKKIKAANLVYQPLEEEMIDHLACLVEAEMETGSDFMDAVNAVFEKNTDKQLVNLEQATISLLTYKSTTMRKVSRLIAACVVLLSVGLIISDYAIAPNEKEYVDTASKIINEPSPKAVFAHQLDPPSRAPLDENFKITSGFGMRIHPIFKEKKMHRGIDLKAKKGTPVYATADGIVEKAVTHNKYGKMIVLMHDTTYQTLYSQLSVFEVKTGMKVKKGDLIGRVGSSGLSTAPHLHYEVLKNGKPENPEKYF